MVNKLNVVGFNTRRNKKVEQMEQLDNSLSHQKHPTPLGNALFPSHRKQSVASINSVVTTDVSPPNNVIHQKRKSLGISARQRRKTIFSTFFQSNANDACSAGDSRSTLEEGTMSTMMMFPTSDDLQSKDIQFQTIHVANTHHDRFRRYFRQSYKMIRNCLKIVKQFITSHYGLLQSKSWQSTFTVNLIQVFVKQIKFIILCIVLKVTNETVTMYMDSKDKIDYSVASYAVLTVFWLDFFLHVVYSIICANLFAFFFMRIATCISVHLFGLNRWAARYFYKLNGALVRSIVSTYALISFYDFVQSHFYEIDNLTDLNEYHNDALHAAYRILVCCSILTWSLLLKSFFTQRLAIKYYFEAHATRLTSIQTYEQWIKVLINRDQLFSHRIVDFLSDHIVTQSFNWIKHATDNSASFNSYNYNNKTKSFKSFKTLKTKHTQATQSITEFHLTILNFEKQFNNIKIKKKQMNEKDDRHYDCYSHKNKTVSPNRSKINYIKGMCANKHRAKSAPTANQRKSTTHSNDQSPAIIIKQPTQKEPHRTYSSFSLQTEDADGFGGVSDSHTTKSQSQFSPTKNYHSACMNTHSNSKHILHDDTIPTLLWSYNAHNGTSCVINSDDLQKASRKLAHIIVFLTLKKNNENKSLQHKSNNNNNNSVVRKLKTLITTSSSKSQTIPFQFDETIENSLNINQGNNSNTSSTTNATTLAARLQSPSLPEFFTSSSICNSIFNKNDNDKNNSNNINKYHNTTIGKRNYLIESDFVASFGKHRRKEAAKAWYSFDYCRTGKVSVSKLNRQLNRWLRDLVYLKQSFDSFHGILNNLDNITAVFMIFVLIFLFLLVFNFDFQESISIYFSIIAIAAVFARNALSQMMDSITFIFLLHPFSVGDVIRMKNVRYTVLQINLLSCVFEDMWGNIEIINNSSLVNQQITNLSRSTNPYHNLTVYVSQYTKTEQLRELRDRFQDFIDRKMSFDVYDVWFVVTSVDKECRLQVSLWVGGYISFADARTRWRHHTQMMIALREIVHDLQIEYQLPIQRYKIINQTNILTNSHNYEDRNNVEINSNINGYVHTQNLPNASPTYRGCACNDYMFQQQNLLQSPTKTSEIDGNIIDQSLTPANNANCTPNVTHMNNIGNTFSMHS